MQAIQFLLDGGEEIPAASTVGSLDSFRDTSICEEGLILPSQAAQVLGVTSQCIKDLLERRRLSSWEFFDRVFVSAREVRSRLLSPRVKGGRPRKVLQSAN